MLKYIYQTIVWSSTNCNVSTMAALFGGVSQQDADNAVKRVSDTLYKTEKNYPYIMGINIIPNTEALEQALKNPKSNAPLNEWLTAQLDARFAEFDAKWDARFTEMDAKWEARHNELEKKLDVSHEFIAHLKDQNKQLLELLNKAIDNNKSEK